MPKYCIPSTEIFTNNSSGSAGARAATFKDGDANLLCAQYSPENFMEKKKLDQGGARVPGTPDPWSRQ